MLTAPPCFQLQRNCFASSFSAIKRRDRTGRTRGAYDHGQLTRYSARHGVAEPIELQHRNAKRLFAKSQRIGKEVGMAKPCEVAGLTLEGTHHRGLDDALNEARLLPWAFGDRLLRGQQHPAL